MDSRFADTTKRENIRPAKPQFMAKSVLFQGGMESSLLVPALNLASEQDRPQLILELPEELQIPQKKQSMKERERELKR